MDKQICYSIRSFCAALTVLYLGRLEYDEIEHLHNGYLVSIGKTPFKDFWEHHLPLIWYVIAPFFHFGNSMLLHIVLIRAFIFYYYFFLPFLSVTFIKRMYSSDCLLNCFL